MKRDNIHDFYFHKAKREKYSARSVYKLQNIQEKYHLFAPGNKILDLGASPGSWTEYLSGLLGSKGQIWALDIKALSPAALNKIHQSKAEHRFLKQSVFESLPEDVPVFDSVISDMAPSTQGNRMVDCMGSLELASRAFELARKHLKNGGHFVVKLFQANETMEAAKSWMPFFKFAKLYRPPAVQKDSKEIYFIGQNFLKVEKD